MHNGIFGVDGFDAKSSIFSLSIDTTEVEIKWSLKDIKTSQRTLGNLTQNEHNI